MTTADPQLVAGRYQVQAPLGEGGMGRVWLARDVVLDREVAVKEVVLPDDLTESERDAMQGRTLQEARAAARLAHPNVARVFDVFEDDGRPWIVMEHVPSRTLQDVMDAEGPLDPKRVAEIGLQVLAALQAAHRAGVRHRDVKPSNVLLADNGRVVLTDFGIATIEGDSNITGSGLVLGSPQFMAPERALRGGSPPESDLWSLGATLYAAVEGRPPYQRPSAVGTLMALASEDPEPPHRAGALRPVLEGLLRKDPDERIDADEAGRRLRKAAGRSRPRRRSRVWLLTLAVVLLAVAGGLTAFALRSDKPASPAALPTTAPVTTAPVTTAPVTTAPATSAPATKAPVTEATKATTGSLPALPAGWEDYHDRTGFSVYVPQGWTKSLKGSMVYFRHDGRVLGIDQTTKPNMNPVGDWQGKAEYRVGRGDFPGYDEIRIKPVSYFKKAADWEFTFDGSGTRQHVNNRGLVVNNHQAYGIYWQTTDADWTKAYPDLQLIFSSFRPTA
ncbi:serine/threonine-protein kinase [Paractinoplanes durhamensis]|nr:serine/threonine-protein kinase [Actinoplanes durhamensis]